MYKYLIIILVIYSGAAGAGAAVNQLRDHPSPYLALHGNDPVNWQEWNKASFARAKKENKLLFVSSGYFSCHWCHVMQRESFSSKEVAGLLNKYFIPIKVDRELNPALDARLIEFTERTQRRAGWPLNVFVTPDGYPLIGMVYLPRQNFITVLNELAKQWQNEKKELNGLAKEMTNYLMSPVQQEQTQQTQQIQTRQTGKSLSDALLVQALDMADELQGGFGEENKFPLVPQLTVLLMLQAKQQHTQLGAFIRLTLEQMSSQGLQDHLGGGFYRYTVDPGWQIPHFEKMLYDNALLADLYLQAAQQFKNSDFEKVGRTTLDFMLGSFLIDKQAMLASFSAVDDKNVEGGYYIWKKDELKGLLSDKEFKVINNLWDIRGSGEVEGAHHLNRSADINEVAHKLGLSVHQARNAVQSAKQKMLLARKKRGLPVDNKQLAAWNGLALSALVRGAQLKNAASYRRAAQQLHTYLTTVLWTASNTKPTGEGQLLRAVSNKKSLGEAGLEDYAYVAAGLLDWAELTQKSKDMVLAENVIKQAWKRFFVNRRWQLSEANLLKYGVGEDVISDGPMPSPSAVLIETTLRMLQHRPDKSLERQATQALRSGYDKMNASPFWYATQIKVIGQFSH